MRKPRRWIEQLPVVLRQDKIHKVVIEECGFRAYVEARLFERTEAELEELLHPGVHYGRVLPPSLRGWNQTITLVCTK